MRDSVEILRHALGVSEAEVSVVEETHALPEQNDF